MQRAAYWKSDWFLGVVVSLVLLAGSRSDLIQSLERKAYDVTVRMSTRTPTDRIAVIAIDDASLARLGRWPWPRDLHAGLTDLLVAANAGLIVNTVFFPAAEKNRGADAIERPLELDAGLDTARQRAASVAPAGRVVLPMLFEPGEAQAGPDPPLPEYIQRHRLRQVAGGGGVLSAVRARIPDQAPGSNAAGIGHLITAADSDGVVRTEPLVARYFDQYYPSLSLMVAAQSLRLGAADIRVALGKEIRVGHLRIPTDPATRMNTRFYASHAGRPAFPVDSFDAVLRGRIPATKYQDKIVLIGITAAGLGNSLPTPVAPAMAPVLMLAHAVSSILDQDFFITPAWGPSVEAGIALLMALYLILLLPQLSTWAGVAATAGLLVALVGAHFGLMLGAGIWLRLMTAALLLLVGHLLLTGKRRLVTGGRGREASAAPTVGSTRMLALACQGQGQLDLAWDKFRQVPLGKDLMENLYNLALDFERKRQLNKADAVFRYMFGYDPKYRDLEARLARGQSLPQTVIPGTARMGAEKAMLGRYRLEQEMGKGAMGRVYLGRDPQLNRVVAIKTMALAQEFAADELADVKQRFFREAETAGRLDHPNIVTMVEAGEEGGLAYIAMEFLSGRDLVPATRPGHLLPLLQVMSIVARVADALDYAHLNHVVHRDIKPANIMVEPESDQVKVTDFGIARLTDSSKTRTGMVLGTPSYMSPEQLAGRPIDGRSDLFSLGVTLYQLCCGRLPFVGESMAQLMLKISSEAPTDIRTLNPDLPECLVAIVNRALAKDLVARYQTGAEFAADLRVCINHVAEPVAASAVDSRF